MTEQQISRTQAWLESLRPKTLPLAFAAIIVGTALAWWQGHFDPLVALLALITAGLLQILSNLANDYGDAVKGSDKPDRIGPLRGMQKGVITQQEMKRALIITVVLICLSGLALVAVACHTLADFVGFLILGGLSIIAAITYTVESDNVVIVIVEHKRIVHGSLVRLVYLKTCYCDISIAV